jgi:hypothetical protein
MPQNGETGDKARRWGLSMCQIVSAHLGAAPGHPGFSNEANWQGRPILIKAAHHGVPQIGATPAILDRIEAIIAALEDQDGKFSLYEVTPQWFKLEMRPSKSHGASHVMMLQCRSVREEGKFLGRM